MTCIVGLVHQGTVYVGGDSAGVAGLSLTVRADVKVFTNGSFLFGFTSSFRMGQLLRFSFQPPYHKPEVDTYRYMCTDFINGVRECLKAGGYARNNSGEESAGTFLVGYRGRLFVIHSDYQVEEPADGYAAVGSGSAIALGAMWATSDQDPNERTLTALRAAERFNAGVRGPFVVEKIESVGQ